jgi:hypothetical protein
VSVRANEVGSKRNGQGAEIACAMACNILRDDELILDPRSIRR